MASPPLKGEGKWEGLTTIHLLEMVRHRDLVTTDRARDLRRGQTNAEVVLWQLLRRRNLNGLKFRRQHPLGGFIVDFFCEKARLVVELDGGGHAEAGQTGYDAQRTVRLERLGVRVLRFWNRDVLLNAEGVLERILERARVPSR
jgi:very-short-patch-repair endonuclease